MSSASISSHAPTTDAFNLRTTYVHLGRGATASPLPDFDWSPAVLEAYTRRAQADGDEGRLVGIAANDTDWPHWERHPQGEEIVVLLSGRADLLQVIDGEVRRLPLTPGVAAINPTGVWHTAEVHEPGELLFVTPGLGTEHSSRDEPLPPS